MRPRQLPFPPPGSLYGLPALHQHSQMHNVQTRHRVPYVSKTHAHAQPRTDTQVPASHLPLTHGWAGSQEHWVLALPLPLVVLDTSLLFSGPQFPYLQSGRLRDLTFPRPSLTCTCMCLPSHCSATHRLPCSPHLSGLHALPSPHAESPGP